eukprot:TRINITY_DN23265_c0_g1_i3.p1 TRINITY_DN23265_c0_g1~~TRINITY_DN23265_c0_g1_i3.p1  ORF type:complete len:115 (+),score=11.29 TRINITY_DN23265_c0_g1_i3:72-416(+)
MQTAKETREARRRKLLERGSDRLAFIAGELKSLPREPQVHQETPSVPQRSVPLVESEELVSSAAVFSATDNETNRDHTPVLLIMKRVLLIMKRGEIIRRQINCQQMLQMFLQVL